MSSKIKMFMLSLLSSISLVTGAVAPLAFAQSTPGTNNSTPSGAVNCGSQADLTAVACQSTATADASINKTVKLSIQVFQVIVGLISVFMLIMAGLKYITSGGDSAGVGSAKNMILYACVGLVVVVLAQIIVGFVLNRVGSTATGI